MVPENNLKNIMILLQSMLYDVSMLKVTGIVMP